MLDSPNTAKQIQEKRNHENVSAYEEGFKQFGRRLEDHHNKKIHYMMLAGLVLVMLIWLAVIIVNETLL